MKEFTLTIQDCDLPEIVPAFLIARDEGKYVIFLDKRLPDKERKASFLHEMLHIYELEYGAPISNINVVENKLHSELPEIIDVMMSHQ